VIEALKFTVIAVGLGVVAVVFVWFVYDALKIIGNR
jgi:hypothetical protein